MLALGVSLGALAEPEPLATCVDRLDDERVSELLAFSEKSAADQRLGAALWFSGWSAFNITNVSIGAWQISVADNRLERDRWIMSTTGAGTFLLGAAALPLTGLYANLRLSRMPASTPDERRTKLKRSLTLLEDAAEGEARNSGLFAHLGGVGFAVASAAYIWLHNLNYPTREVALAAGIHFAASIAGAQATLWTVPRRARRDLETAEVRCGRRTKESALPLRSLALHVTPTYLGVRFAF